MPSLAQLRELGGEIVKGISAGVTLYLGGLGKTSSGSKSCDRLPEIRCPEQVACPSLSCPSVTCPEFPVDLLSKCLHVSSESSHNGCNPYVFVAWGLGGLVLGLVLGVLGASLLVGRTIRSVRESQEDDFEDDGERRKILDARARASQVHLR